MQTNLKTFLVIAVMVVVALFAGLLYYLIYLHSGNQLLAVIFGGVVAVFGGYATVYLFGLADKQKREFGQKERLVWRLPMQPLCPAPLLNQTRLFQTTSPNC